MASLQIYLRTATAADLPVVARLDRLAFAPQRTDTEIQQEWFAEGLNRPGRQVFLAVDAATGECVGSYTQLELNLFLAGKTLPTLGIGSVAVAPHRRGQQIARRMLEHAVRQGRSRPASLTMLYPFQHGFYRRLGWAWTGQSYHYQVHTHHLPLYSERGNIQPYNPAHHREALPALYGKAAIAHNGWLQRQPWQWEQILKTQAGREIYCYVEAGELSGYVIFYFVATPKGITGVMREWVALTSAAYRGIVGFIAALRDQIQTLTWNTHATDPFPHLLKEPRRASHPPETFDFGLVHPLGEIGSGFMWRIIDAPVALSQRVIQPVDPFSVTFQVEDPILGPTQFTAEFAKGQIQLVTTPAPTVIKLSIEQLTQLFAGFRRSQELVWTEEIEVEGDNQLLAAIDTALEIPDLFCWDFF